MSSPAPSRPSGGRSKSDARALAIRLFHGRGTRLSHSAAVAAQVDRVVALVGPGWRSSLEAAAWRHDIGYSSAVAATEFHPLDGARWLRKHNWPSETCRLVAWHTEPLEEARLRNLDVELVAEFDRPDRLAAAALTWADLTSSPCGERWDPEQRLADILMRYPPGSPVHEATRSSLPVLRRRVHRGSSSLRRMTRFRTGIGHDIDRLVPGRELVLGGITIDPRLRRASLDPPRH